MALLYLDPCQFLLHLLYGQGNQHLIERNNFLYAYQRNDVVEVFAIPIRHARNVLQKFCCISRYHQDIPQHFYPNILQAWRSWQLEKWQEH